MSNLPIWAQPPPGARKPRFTREQIAAAALQIADKDGFGELSMRRVADALGAGTMTLYYYIRTKDDLLELMDDALMAEVVNASTPLPKHWRAAIETIARGTRATFSRHRWALTAMEGARMGGPNNLRHMEQSLTAIASLDLPTPTKFELLSIVDDFVFGTALRERDTQLELTPESLTTLNDLTKHFLAQGEYPHLQALIGDREPVDAFGSFAESVMDGGRFERGLAMILDGFSAKYGLSDRPAAKPRRGAQHARKPAVSRRRR
ncbi:MAG TPA: TetR/AcrR family transcriptional regulator C-terminal domain-containing protein [Kofleriaceae bacterium]